MKARLTREGRSLIILALTTLMLVVASQYAFGQTTLLDEERGVLSVASVIERVAPAVVNISVRTRVPGTDNPLFRDPFFRRYFGLPDRLPERESMSAGSGVIVDAEMGYVLTNHHVVDNADEISVKLKDGRQFKAKFVGSDPGTDIGLIQIESERLTSVQFGDSDKVKVGDFVIAIGNPFGLGQTVTSGLISALGRSGLSREKYEDFIQTDAPINPGNSGGALINTKGELVGINTAIIAPGGGNVGIGFAVPTKMARAIMEQLVRYGEVKRGRVGVAVQDVTPDIAQALELPGAYGVLVSQVDKDSPAEEAGLQPGDAILAIDGQRLRDGNDLRNRIGLRERGSKVRFDIIRSGERKEVSVQVGAPRLIEFAGGAAIPKLTGVKITEIPKDHPAEKDVDGVYVAEVATGSPAWRLGLRVQDIILAVNRQPIKSVSEFERAAKSADRVLAFNVLRGDAQLFIVVQ